MNDTTIQRALTTGLRWVTEVVQPDGAAVNPADAAVVVHDFLLTFGAESDGSARVAVERCDRTPLELSHRLYWELMVNATGHGVVGHVGFDGSEFSELIIGTTPHPSLVAAIRRFETGPRGTVAPVRADFTAVLEAENERLRVELEHANKALEQALAHVRASGVTR